MFTTSGDPAIDAYIHFWTGFIDAQALGQPNYAAMTRNASGQALAWTQDAVNAYVTYG